jgi:hypothetical protein
VPKLFHEIDEYYLLARLIMIGEFWLSAQSVFEHLSGASPNMKPYEARARLSCPDCESIYECTIQLDLIPEAGSFECEVCGGAVVRWKTFRPFSEFKLVSRKSG